MTTTTDRLLRLPDVLARVGLRRSAWYALVARGEAPAPVRLTRRATAWRESDLAAWIAGRPSTVATAANPRARQATA